MNQQRLSVVGYLLLISVIIGWGTSWPFLKIGLSEIPALTYRGLIAPSAAIFMFSVGIVLGKNMRVPKGHLKFLIPVSFFNILLWHVFSAWGISLLESGQASIIAYTMPLWAVIFSIILNKEKPHLQCVIGLILGIFGLLALALGDIGIFNISPLGSIMMLVAAISWGAGTAIHKSVQWKMPTIALAGWQLLIGGLPITIAAIFLESHLWPNIIHTISLDAVLSTLLVLCYPIIFCWFAWFKIVSEVPVSVSAVSIMLVPVIGVLSGHLILGEKVGLKEIASLSLVCGALVLVLLPPFKKNIN